MFKTRHLILLAASAATLASLSVFAPASAREGDKPVAESAARPTDERVTLRLQRMADRLEIKASQQAAWREFAAAYKTLFETERVAPPADSDAAARVRLRAERATKFAARLSKLADATARLQQVLAPEQRQTLDQMGAAAAHRHGDHCGHGMGGEHGHGGGHDREHDREHGPEMR
jgi:hypothetical protein